MPPALSPGPEKVENVENALQELTRFEDTLFSDKRLIKQTVSFYSLLHRKIIEQDIFVYIAPRLLDSMARWCQLASLDDVKTIVKYGNEIAPTHGK